MRIATTSTHVAINLTVVHHSAVMVIDHVSEQIVFLPAIIFPAMVVNLVKKQKLSGQIGYFVVEANHVTIYKTHFQAFQQHTAEVYTVVQTTNILT